VAVRSVTYINIGMSALIHCGSVFLFGLSRSRSSKSHGSSPTYRLKTTSRNAPKLSFFRAKIWNKIPGE